MDVEGRARTLDGGRIADGIGDFAMDCVLLVVYDAACWQDSDIIEVISSRALQRRPCALQTTGARKYSQDVDNFIKTLCNFWDRADIVLTSSHSLCLFACRRRLCANRGTGVRRVIASI